MGIKSEIHSCSITFMRYALKGYFDESDVKVLERAFEARIDHQYYVRKIPKAEKLDELFESEMEKLDQVIRALVEEEIEEEIKIEPWMYEEKYWPSGKKEKNGLLKGKRIR